MNLIYVIFVIFAIKNATPMPQQAPSQLAQKQNQRVQDDKNNSKSSIKTQHHSDKKQLEDQMAAASSIAQDKEDQYGAATVLENPHYDPNLYHSFIPADAVQQYMNYFNPQYVPQYTPNSSPTAAASQPIPYAVQTGYEGYIVPEYPTQIVETSYPGLIAIVKGLIPKFFLAWIVKSAAVVLTTLGVVFFGGALTTAICSLTPLCTIKFSSLPIFKWKTAAEEVGKAIGAELTTDRVRRAAEFLQEAIEKFSKLETRSDYES